MCVLTYNANQMILNAFRLCSRGKLFHLQSLVKCTLTAFFAFNALTRKSLKYIKMFSSSKRVISLDFNQVMPEAGKKGLHWLDLTSYTQISRKFYLT